MRERTLTELGKDAVAALAVIAVVVLGTFVVMVLR